MSNVDIAKLSKNGYKGPTLIVESFQYGNIARFINDCWAREGGRKTINAKSELVWDAKNGVPQVLIKAIKWIGKDDEIVSDYGEDFWKKFRKCNMIFQTNYWKYASQRVKHLEDMIQRRGLRLPEPIWNKENISQVALFNPQAVDYSDFKDPQSN
jgi:hypothetical protein